MTEAAVEAVREFIANYTRHDESGEPCDGCVSMTIRAIFTAHFGTDIVHHYSAALDEIYALRTALAVEASIIQTHLQLKGFPKSRRAIAEEQVARMRVAATLRARTAYRELSDRYKELKRIGGDTLTRAQWEARES